LVDKLLNATVQGLRRDNPELAQAVEKWSTFLVSRVNKAAAILELDPEDVFSEMLLGLVKVGEMYRHPLYRFQRNLFHIVAFDGDAVHIKTLKSNTTLKRSVWTDSKNLEAVKRGSLSSSVYREINQKYCNMLNAHFRAKNGYEKTDGGERAVVTRSGSTGLKTKKRRVFDVKKTVHRVSMGDSPMESLEYDAQSHPTSKETAEYLSDTSSNPERCVSYQEIFGELDQRLSDPALQVLGCLIEEPGLSDQKLVRITKMPNRVISVARNEILRDYFDVEGIPPPTLVGKHPIYLRANQVC
jgi:hypothetical protein